MSDSNKISGIRRLAYQVPEVVSGICGRSFEQAFILANQKLFGLEDDLKKEDLEIKSWDLAASVKVKSDFALKYAIDETEWEVPRYILEGLRWLTQGTRETSPASAPQAEESLASPA